MVEQALKLGMRNSRSVARAVYTEERTLAACMPADKTGYDSTSYMDHANVSQRQKAIVLDPRGVPYTIAVCAKSTESSTCVTSVIRSHPPSTVLVIMALYMVSGGRTVLCTGSGEVRDPEFCIIFVKQVSKSEWTAVIRALYDSNPDNLADYGKFYEQQSAYLRMPSVRKPRIPTCTASGGKRMPAPTCKLGGGRLPIVYASEFFEDQRGLRASAINESGHPEEKEQFRWTRYIDVYFSDDAEIYRSKMKTVKANLFKPEILRVHNLKTECKLGVFPWGML